MKKTLVCIFCALLFAAGGCGNKGPLRPPPAEARDG
ncbi:MAG: LPS translocon maturation chaperone LptM [Gammaproteobacteria bacterium]